MTRTLRPFIAALLMLAALSVHAAPTARHRTLKPIQEGAGIGYLQKLAGGPYMFIAYGDTRSHPEDHRAVIGAIVKERPEFVLQSGDLVADGYNAAQWSQFDQITQPLRDAGIGYYPARGNHDRGPYYAKRVTAPYDSGNPYYYAFTRHHSRFIILDSMDPDEFDPGGKQSQWLVRELAQAQKTALNTFVMFHESAYSVGPHGPTPDAQRYLQPLFVKYKPRAVFCGHDHLYYRTTRAGVTYFVTGGGGAPLYEPVNKALAIPGDVYASVHHYIRCEVDGPRVTFTTVNLDGTDIPVRGAPPTVTVVGPGGKSVTHAIPLGPRPAVIDKITLGPK